MNENLKKILKTFLELFGVFVLITIFTHLNVFAGVIDLLPLNRNNFERSNIPTPPPGKTGQQLLKDLVIGGLGYIKAITVVIGILYLTIAGFKLVIAQGNEEEISTARKGIIYALIAFLIISMSQDMAKIFDMEKDSLLKSPQEILERVHLFDKQVEIFMTFIKYAIGAYATLMIVISAISLITAGGNEEETTKHKKSIMFSMGGLLLLYVGEIFIQKVFYKVDKEVYSGVTGVHPGIDAKEGVDQIAGITNFIVSFAAPIAILMLIVGAILYATAGGEQEKMDKAKRLIFATIIGIVIIYGAFAFVSTVLSSKLVDIGAIKDL